MYLQLYQHSVWCKTPYIGIPAQELLLKQPAIYSQPPFRRLREGRAGERGETKKEREKAKIRGTVKRDVGQIDALSPWDGGLDQIKTTEKHISVNHDRQNIKDWFYGQRPVVSF